MASWVPPLDVPTKKRIDQACLGFEKAWREGGHPAVAPYLAGVAEPARSELLRELLLLDVDYRQQAGESPQVEQYAAAFPAHRSIIDAVFGHAGPASIPPEPATGRFGDYELLEEIARGGMGVVYRARHISLDRIVALKMILAGPLASTEDVERFLREARTGADLQHTNIVAIHDVGEHAGQHFFAMDYVAGTSLAALARDGPLPARRAATYLEIVARAVHYAHQRGTLHRDLKPSNVIIDAADQPRITDFGLAKRIRPGAGLTVSGQVLGTPSYMPPEQAMGDGEAFGPASDVYSLGATLYELLTGRPPFHGASTVDTLLHVLDNDPVPPRLLNPSVPRDLEVICLKCLEKEPRRRYATAQTLAEDLQRFLADQPIRARPIGPLGRLRRWCRRRPMLAGMTAALATALLAGTAVSTHFAVEATRSAAVAESKTAEATDRLWHAYLAQAQAARRSGRPGQRFDSLEALAAATAIRPSPELRDEIIACAALTDLRRVRNWPAPNPLVAVGDTTGQRYVVSTNKSTLSLRSVDDNRELAVLAGPDGRVMDYAFSADGSRLAVSFLVDDRRECHVWSPVSGSAVWHTPLGAEFVSMSFSPDGQSLALLGIDGQVRICAADTGQPLRAWACAPSPTALCFDPTGQTIAASRWQSQVVQILDADTGEVLQSLKHPCGVYRVGWHPDGRFLAVPCGDANIYVWNAETGQQRTLLQGHVSEVIGAVFHPRGDVLASRSWDGTVRLWEPFGGRQLLQFQGGSLWMAFSRDGRWLTLRSFDRLERWEVATGDCRNLHEAAPGKGPWSVHFDCSGNYLASASDDGVRLWDARRGQEVAHLAVGLAMSAIFHPDGHSLFTSGAAGVQHWPVTAPTDTEPLRVQTPLPINGPSRNVSPRACLSADARVLAVLTDRARIAILHSDDRAEPSWIDAGAIDIAGWTLSPDARWIAVAPVYEAGVQIWDVMRGQQVTQIPVAREAGHLAFSPDGRWLVAGTDRTYEFWQAGSWLPGRSIARDGEGTAGPLAFTADSQLLAIAATRYVVQLHDVATAERLATLESPDQLHLTWLCFNPDGSQLVAAGQNHTIQIWDLRAIGRHLPSLGLHFRARRSMAPTTAAAGEQGGRSPERLFFGRL